MGRILELADMVDSGKLIALGIILIIAGGLLSGYIRYQVINSLIYGPKRRRRK